MGDQNLYQQDATESTAKKNVEYTVRKRPPRPLSKLEEEMIQQRRRLIYEHYPELIPIIKEATVLGLINGWRDVCMVLVKATGEQV